MEVAFGHLRFTPETFWQMSLKEWVCAVKGYQKSQGIDENAAMTREDLNNLVERFNGNWETPRASIRQHLR